MEQYDDIIIGSGLGGLTCAYILAKHGRKVCVLEREAQIGGCLQTFKRGKTEFDTGFHYIGGLAPGQPLHQLFDYFNLLDLPWQQLDTDAFDEVCIDDKSYFFANGHKQFIERLAADFPQQRAALEAYTDQLKQVGDHLFDALKPKRSDDLYTTSLFTRSAYDFLNETISDPLLRQVLSGTSLKLELSAETLPLYVFAQINNSFIQSAWRLKGGGRQIADRLAEQVETMGGRVRRRAEVTRLVTNQNRITAVEINGEEQLAAKQVISGAHPAVTLDLFDENGIRKIYRNRIQSLPNTVGMFTANLRLKPDTIPYLNRNIYVNVRDADLWHPVKETTNSVLVSYQAPQCSEYTDNIDLLSMMTWEEVAPWAATKVGRRGDDYVAMKQQKTEQMLSLVERRLPELHGAIDHVFTSTPISYHEYTKTYYGSTYGIRKDFNNPMGTILAPKTPIENLLLTGQSLNLHGVLGVTMTSLFTCAHILGMDTIQASLKLE